MDDATTPDTQLPRRLRFWLLVPCLLLGITGALLPFSSLRSRGAPIWLATLAALVVFPVLPLVWHALAERKRAIDEQSGPAAPFNRFALRSLALALLVLAVSLASLGPRPVWAGLAGLVRGGRPEGRGAAPPAVPRGPEIASAARHELESFIPADASLVVALSDAAVLEPLLARSGVDTDKKLAALEKCQIQTSSARVLIVARDSDTRMVVVRAQGITDPRNLYCLVGVLGSDRLKLRFTSEKAPVRFEVDGLLGRTLKFEAVDARTVVTADGTWADGVQKQLFSEAGARADGPLGVVLERVDRGARLWAGGLIKTDKGSWDLALDARLEGTEVKLRGSSIPPSGESEKAELDLRVPRAFAAALPEGALREGMRGVLAVIAAAGAGWSAPPPAVAPTPTRGGKTPPEATRPSAP